MDASSVMLSRRALVAVRTFSVRRHSAISTLAHDRCQWYATAVAGIGRDPSVTAADRTSSSAAASLACMLRRCREGMSSYATSLSSACAHGWIVNQDGSARESPFGLSYPEHATQPLQLDSAL